MAKHNNRFWRVPSFIGNNNNFFENVRLHRKNDRWPDNLANNNIYKHIKYSTATATATAAATAAATTTTTTTTTPNNADCLAGRPAGDKQQLTML